MTHRNSSSTGRIDRRTFLRGGLAGAALAGGSFTVGRSRAASGGSGGGPADGTLVVAAAGPPDTLNPLEALVESPGRPFSLHDAVYDRGVRFHPETNDPVPWAFADWTLREDNVGTDDAAVLATLRDGLTWHDGEPVTAADVAFTFEEVLTELGNHPDPDVEKVSTVRTSGAREVEFVLDGPIPTWHDTLLGQLLLPEHVWADVDDPATYEPRTAGGPVGSGPFAVESVEWPADVTERSVVLRARDDHPVPPALDLLADDGPVVDRLRFEFHDGGTATLDAVFDGRAGVSAAASSQNRQFFERAVEARSLDDLALLVNPTDGWEHVSFNLRRVPLDDRPFRHFLAHAWDERFHVETAHRGLGTDGDLVAPPPLRNVRPFEPDDPEVEQYGFFRADDGGLDVEAARDFLRDADGVHDYSFGPVESDLVTGDEELRVDGELLPDAHTDNDGTPGQGPLEFLAQPADEGRWPDALTGQRWVAHLREVGVPVETTTATIGSMIGPVFRREEFDVFELGWGVRGHQVHYLEGLFHSRSADLDGDAEGFRSNAMGYSGADDLVDRQATIMDPAERREVVGEAMMRIYEDAPTMVVDYGPVLQPVSTTWTGFVGAAEGVNNVFSWVNVRSTVPEVTVDVKPDSDDNTVNPRGRGLIPVAVLQTDDLDPSRVDVASLQFGSPAVVDDGGGATPAHAGHLENVDDDGNADLVVHFPTRAAGFEVGDETAVLVGETTDGTPLRGSDAVTVVAGGRGNDGARSGGGEGGRGDGPEDGPAGGTGPGDGSDSPSPGSGSNAASSGESDGGGDRQFAGRGGGTGSRGSGAGGPSGGAGGRSGGADGRSGGAGGGDDGNAGRGPGSAGQGSGDSRDAPGRDGSKDAGKGRRDS